MLTSHAGSGSEGHMHGKARVRLPFEASLWQELHTGQFLFKE